MFNVTWIKEIKQKNIEKEISKIINFFNPLPFALWMGPNTFPKISAKILNNFGFIKEANEIGMCYDLNYLTESGHNFDSINIIEVNILVDKTKYQLRFLYYLSLKENENK